MKLKFHNIITDYIVNHKYSLLDLNPNFVDLFRYALLCRLNNEFYDDNIQFQNVLIIDSEHFSESILDKYNDHIFIIKTAQEVSIEPSSNIKAILQAA